MLQWPDNSSGFSIAFLELVPIVIAAALWGRLWQGQRVCSHSDNEGAISVVSKGYTSDTLLIHLMRCLSFFAAFYRFHFGAVHIPGAMNEAADALSRGRMELLFSIVPQVGVQSQVPVPRTAKALIDWQAQLGLSGLDQEVQELLGSSISPSTALTYASGWRQYTGFCEQFNIQPLPLQEPTLCRFVAFLVGQSLHFQTV